MNVFACLFCFLCIGLTLSAQEKSSPGGIFNHVIEVDAYPDWGQGYLTIIDPHYCTKQEQGENRPSIYALTLSAIGETFHLPDVGDIILEVNGKTGKNMSPQQFYALTDTATTFSLTWKDRLQETFSQQFRVNRVLGPGFREYDFEFWSRTKNNEFRSFMYYGRQDNDSSSLGRRNAIQDNPFQSISDKKYDFQKAQTYDYVIVGNDPLNDEKILDAIDKLGMERDSKNPDILFTIAKNADERISSTYIPPTSRTINTGSTTTARYNYLTKGYDYNTRQNYQTINEGGYTERTKTTDIFLELAALDAKKVNDKSISYAPILWQFTASENLLNAKIKNMDKYLIYASWAYVPPGDRYVSKKVTLYQETGLVPDKENSSLVAEVKAGSRAEKAGFQKGDIITKIECTYWTYHSYSWRDGGFSVKHTKIVKNKNLISKYESDNYRSNDRHNINVGLVEYLNYNDSKSWFGEILSHTAIVTVMRGKQKLQLTLSPRYATFSRVYWLNNAQLEQVCK